MRLKADLTLLLVAAIWGSAFAAQRMVADHVGPFLFNGSRFLLAGVLLLPLVRFRLKLDKKKFIWVGAAGALLCGGSVLQQAGLQWTTAGNAGFITGLYVVFVPILLLVVLRQRARWTIWAAALLAAVGMFLLSAGGKLELAPGDGLELAGAGLWAAHIIVVGRAMQEMETLPFAIGQILVAGVLNLALGLGLEWKTLPGLATAWWSVAYVGIFSVAVAYTLQAWAQKHAPPPDAALILSLESVFAALFGYLLLGETLRPEQLLGCGLILGAILLAQFGPIATPVQPNSEVGLQTSDI
jgi:drug/metabolite transporter (DMT)-like permease